MNVSFDFALFSQEVERTATALLDDGGGSDAFIQTARVVQEMAETALARNRGDTSRIACRAGCGHCCVLNVAVLEPEAVTIVAYLERKLLPSQIVSLRRQIDDLHDCLRWLDDDERVRLRRPCAFLDAEGKCSIYPVRPLLCRGLNSTDPESCRKALDLLFLDAEPQILSNLFQSALFSQAFLALARAMENAGLDSRSRELTAAVKTHLDDCRPEQRPRP